MPAVFDIFLYILFLDPKHNMKKGTVDPGVCDLPRFQEIAELLIIEEVVELGTDAVRQLLGDIHVECDVFRLLVELIVFLD